MEIHGESIEHPEEVIAYDRQAQAGKFRVVALGDSTTLCRRQEKGQRWPDLLEAECGPECAVTNAGIGGTSSSLGLFRWHRDVAPVEPDCVIINFLLNDSAIRHYECSSSYLVQCSIDRLDANWRTLADLSWSLGAEPVFMTPPPVPPFAEQFKSEHHQRLQMDLLERYADRLERVAAELEVPLAHLWHTFPELVDEYPGPYFDPPDGYHSNIHSQPIIAQELARLVSPLMNTDA